MIGYLEGKLRFKSPEYLLIDVHGVGYVVHVPLSTFYEVPDPGGAVGLNIHTLVREDDIQLYGFRTVAEKDMFLRLITVNGVGPRLAINILSGLSPDDLRRVVLQQEAGRLKHIPGVGKKIAERIMLELRDKLKVKKEKESEHPGPADVSSYADAFSALINLGYRPAEAEKSLERAVKALGENPPVERLLKESLRFLA